MALRPNATGTVLGLAAIVALAWFFLRPTPRDVPPESSRSGGATEPEDSTTLRAPAVTRDPRRDVGSSPDVAAAEHAGPPGVAAPLTLAGRVVLPTGKPGVGTRIYASPATSDSRLIGCSTESDATGGFAFESLATPGEYALRAVLTEGGEWFGSTTAHTGDREVRLAMQVGVDPDTILVRVLGSDGTSVASAIGALRTASSYSHVRVEQGRLFFDVRSHAKDDLAGAYVLISRPKGPGGAPLAFGDARLDGVRGGGIYELRLPREVSVSGVVVGPDGRGVAGARLGVVRVDDAYEFDREVCRDDVGRWKDDDVVRSRSDGTFRIGQVGEDEQWALIDPPAHFLRTPALRVRSGATNVRFVLREGTSAVIRVFDPDGSPVAGASVRTGDRADPRDCSRPRSFFYSSDRATGDDGSVVVPHLEPSGTQVLSVLAPDARDDLLDYVRTEWSPSDTLVRLERGLPLGGVVRDTAGVAVGRATVRCREADGTTWRSAAGEDGRFRFGAMPAISVELSVEDAPPGSPGALRVNTGRRDVVLTVAKIVTPDRK